MATLAAHIERPRPPVAEPPQGLALTYHRLMLVMLLFVGVTVVIVGRLALLQVFNDRSGARRRSIRSCPRAATSSTATACRAPAPSTLVDRHYPARSSATGTSGAAAPRSDARSQRRAVSRAAAPSRYSILARRASAETVAAVNALASPHRLQTASPSDSIRKPRWPPCARWTDMEPWRRRHGAGARRAAARSGAARRAGRAGDRQPGPDACWNPSSQALLSPRRGPTGRSRHRSSWTCAPARSSPWPRRADLQPQRRRPSDANALYTRATMALRARLVFKPITVARRWSRR